MAARKTLNISLTPRLQKMVDRHVASGLYQSASEVVRQGLRLLEERDRAQGEDLDRVRKKIAVGLKQAKSRQLLDGSEVFDAIRAEIGKGKRRRRAG